MALNNTMCIAAFGAAAMTAFLTALLRRKTPTVAMAATSGQRQLWLPGAKAPEYLTGVYIGDRGFDPLGLAADPKAFARNRVAEVFHGRLAMLAVAGALVPELFFEKETWFEVPQVDSTVLATFVIASLVAFAPLELWRYNAGFGWEKRAGKDENYPGFDPLGLTSDDTKLKELKNGRLAMTAVLGFAIQAAYTGQSPLANLAAHYADPFGANITTAMF